MLQVAQLEVALLLGGVNLVADNLDIGCLSHTAHEEQTGTDKAHLNSNGQVENNGQQERYPQHDDVALRVLHD